MFISYSYFLVALVAFQLPTITMSSSSCDASLFDTFAKKTLPKATDKVFAITGTTYGTGFIAARTVAENGGTVVLLNRSEQMGPWVY